MIPRISPRQRQCLNPPSTKSPNLNTARPRLHHLASGKQLFVLISMSRRNIAIVGKNKEEERLLKENCYDFDGGVGLFTDTIAT